MKTKKILKPGEPGTKKWFDKYGDKLFCVRYRYDSERKIKLKTVEIIVDEAPYIENKNRTPRNKNMDLKVSYDEKNLRAIIKAAGGRWNRKERVWKLSYGEVIDLGLLDRVIKLPKYRKKKNE